MSSPRLIRCTTAREEHGWFDDVIKKFQIQASCGLIFVLRTMWARQSRSYRRVVESAARRHTFRHNPHKVAEALFMWAFHSEKLPEQVTQLHGEFRGRMDIDYAAFYREYIHFRLFVTDWVLQGYECRDGSMRGVREAFNLLVALMEKQQPQRAEVQKELEVHLSAYAAAINRDDHLGPAHATATAFLELCGDRRSSAHDISLVLAMSLEFAALAEAVRAALE